MMKTVMIWLILAAGIQQAAYTQQQDPVSQKIDLGIEPGNTFGISGSYFHNWKIGRKHKWEIGIGARVNMLRGKELYYTTAPARLTSGKTGPLVFFTRDITENIDSLLVQSPATTSINMAVEFGYHFSQKWFAAFNIDLLGVTFGKKFNDGLYIRDNQGTTGVKGKPTVFNLLLTSDNDLGSLASAFYIRYTIARRWALHGGVTFDFSEYTTEMTVQELPSRNDRFRYKSFSGLAGVTYFIK